MHGMVAPCWNFPDGFCADWTLEEPLVASNKGDPKPHDPLITTVACKHVWGGLIPPLQHDCVFGCKFLPAVKSEKTLISSVCPPVPPAGNDRFTRGSSTYQFPSPPQLEHMEYIVVWGKYILRISPAPLQERSRVDYSRCHKTAHWKRVKWPATVNGTQRHSRPVRQAPKVLLLFGFGWDKQRKLQNIGRKRETFQPEEQRGNIRDLPGKIRSCKVSHPGLW